MRLFFAIELDRAARQRVADEQQRLRALVRDDATLRWMDSEQLHITLVFLGEVTEPAVTRLVGMAARPIDMSPFTLSFGGTGFFPPAGAPRVLWMGALEGAAQAGAVQRAIGDRAAACGVTFEQRPFRPHLTLARVRGQRGGSARLRRQLSTAAGDRHDPVARISVHGVTLFRSLLSPQGSTYAALARAPLAEPPLQ